MGGLTTAQLVAASAWGATVLFLGATGLVHLLVRGGVAGLRLVCLFGVALAVCGFAGQARAQAEPWPGFVYCAPENGECGDAPASAVVRFGAPGSDMYVTRTKIDGVPLYCSWQAFGSDPAGGYEKVCAYGAVATPGDGGGASQPGASLGNNPFYLTAEQGTAIFAAIFGVWAAAFTWRAVMDVLDTRGDRD